MSLKNNVKNLHLEVSQKTNQINHKVDNLRQEISELEQEISNGKQEVQQAFEQLEQRINQKLDLIQQNLASLATSLQPVSVSEMTLTEQSNQWLRKKQTKLSNKIRGLMSQNLILVFGVSVVLLLAMAGGSHFVMDYANTVKDFSGNFIEQNDNEKPVINNEVSSKEDEKPFINLEKNDIEITEGINAELNEIDIQ